MKPSATATKSKPGFVKVVLSDDNTLIRYTLKTFLARLSQKNKNRIKTFTSSNGIETLGYIFIVNPEIVVIDTTLPKYSGREIMDFLIKNLKLKKTKIIILHDGVQKLNLPDNFIVLDKFNNKFLDTFIKHIIELSGSKFKNRLSRMDKLAMYFGKNVLKWANASDVLMFKMGKGNFLIKLLLFPIWFLTQIINSFYLAFLRIICGEAKEENIKQEQKDLKVFRVMYYPTMATILSSVIFLLLQVVLFITGGFVILNTKVESVLTSQAEHVVFGFHSADFNIDGPKIKEGSLTFSPSEIDKSLASNEFSKHQLVVFSEEVEYSRLDKLIEKSSFNTAETSTNDPQSLTIPANSITYQLSNNKEFWAYVNKHGEWDIAMDEWKSSNTVQEINKYLKDFNKTFGGNKLFIRAFFNSDGQTSIRLSELSIERKLNSIYFRKTEETSRMVSQFEPVDLSFEEIEVEESLPKPVIYYSSFYNGKKLVYGKLTNDAQLSAGDLSRYIVNVYYSRLVAEPVKGLLLGSSKLSYSDTTGYSFLVESDFFEGFVTAELEYRNEDGLSITSELSDPIGDSTFIEN